MVLIIQEPRAHPASAFALTISSTRPCEHARWRLQMGTDDVNARADDGRTPLSLAAEAKRADLAKVLEGLGGAME